MHFILMAMVFGTIGFVIGWRYGYKEVTGDIEKIVKRIQSRRR